MLIPLAWLAEPEATGLPRLGTRGLLLAERVMAR
jgi:hypothetical protein